MATSTSEPRTSDATRAAAVPAATVAGIRRSRIELRSATVAAIALLPYPLLALVLVPEGEPAAGERALTLVVIAALAAAGAALAKTAPRSLRGLVMVAVGFAGVAVTAGVVAKRLMDGISGTDVAGVVFGVASVTLIVAGWRRTLAPLRRPWVRVFVAIVGTVAVLQLVVLPAVFALDVTNRARPTASGRTPGDVGLPFTDVRITADDGVSLAGWWVTSRNGAAVIVLPGSGSTRDDVLDHAAVLARHGYGTLLLDWRGHGASDGRLHEFGWGHDADVRSAISWVAERPEVRAGIGLLGLSMGGEVALTTAAIDERVDAIVAEGVSARTMADAQERPSQGPIPAENMFVMYTLTGLFGRADPPEPLVEVVRSIDVPVLLIAGNEPNEAMLSPVYAARGRTVDLWELPDTGHMRTLATHPVEWETRVTDTFAAELVDDPAREVG